MNQTSGSTDPIATCHVWADAATASWCVVRVFSNQAFATEIFANGNRALFQPCDSLSAALIVADAFRQEFLTAPRRPRASAA
jgi:hypothetical protein